MTIKSGLVLGQPQIYAGLFTGEALFVMWGGVAVVCCVGVLCCVCVRVCVCVCERCWYDAAAPRRDAVLRTPAPACWVDASAELLACNRTHAGVFATTRSRRAAFTSPLPVNTHQV
jgi:hypothetical protein